MTPLEAAKKVAEPSPFRWWCQFCEHKSDGPHAPDCVAPDLPKVVAALEAAELVTSAAEEERILFGVRAGSHLVAALNKLDEALDA